MRELALSRGFYPVVAIDMSEGGQSKGRGKSSGKGKSKGKGHGKSGGGKGKGAGNHPLPGARHFVFGRRGRTDTASATSTQSKPTGKSTASGSTAQHGPRSKRY